eukprot:CAMPEP_0185177638 /NCGR_PEP_ID=MMETSP1139-20130426/29982_1 /TAXON_ID=298111 /ORGANISM="Pavlova sp., Strain CCMP459" /LENGTH=47 /DNA_ID= /DNA_START= /DNA_END= /DNA_ORIENTATION=
MAADAGRAGRDEFAKEKPVGVIRTLSPQLSAVRAREQSVLCVVSATA